MDLSFTTIWTFDFNAHYMEASPYAPSNDHGLSDVAFPNGVDGILVITLFLNGVVQYSMASGEMARHYEALVISRDKVERIKIGLSSTGHVDSFHGSNGILVVTKVPAESPPEKLIYRLDPQGSLSKVCRLVDEWPKVRGAPFLSLYHY